LTRAERDRAADPISRGLLTGIDGRLRLTLEGRLLADAVVRDLLD
jgi:oxygen-independent coproporphyrinogen-3 oxidase